MSKTKIQWTGETWNPTTGCSKVSPGCQNCFAERLAIGRLKGKKGYPGLPWTKVNAPTNVVLHPDRLEVPLRRKKPTTFFVNSMSDLFHEEVPDEFIDRVFAVMALAPQHVFQVLTKRADRMRDYLTARREEIEEVVAFSAIDLNPDEAARLGGRWEPPQSAPDYIPGYFDGIKLLWPLPGVWLGASAEDQKRLDERVPDLLATPAAVRFVSAEPLLEPLKFRQDWLDYLEGWYTETESGHDCHGIEEVCAVRCPVPIPVQTQSAKLDWVIVGGESGPGARPTDLAWARDIVRQCREAGIACFVKQLGSSIRGDFRYFPKAGPPGFGALPMTPDGRGCRLEHPKGGDPGEWPEDLRVREYRA